jgi:hypothetical protein
VVGRDFFLAGVTSGGCSNVRVNKLCTGTCGVVLRSARAAARRPLSVRLLSVALDRTSEERGDSVFSAVTSSKLFV